MHTILIIGCGSIGERHLRCFQNTGRCRVTACDSNPALLEQVRDRYGVEAYASLEDALACRVFDAAVICTPADLHLPMTIKLLAAGLHVLIEKPLAVDQQMVPATREAVLRSGRFVAVAYIYHFMAAVVTARAAIHNGEIGKVLQASVVSGQHFPTFRPAYRDIYYRDRRRGGGAIQDALTHLANTMEWLLGPANRVYCDATHRALDGVDVEDFAHAVARHGEVPVSYALTQFQAPNEHHLLINGETASIKLEFHSQRCGVLRHGESEWQWHACPWVERDALFVTQANAFIDAIEGRPTNLCSFDEAVQTLRFNEAALRSADSGEVVNF